MKQLADGNNMAQELTSTRRASSTISGGLLGVLASLVLGCGSGAEPLTEEGELMPSVRPLAELTLADGSRLEFLEPTDGLLLANALGERGSQAITLMEQHEGDVVKLYESASGQGAPALLVEAQGRASRLSDSDAEGFPPRADVMTLGPVPVASAEESTRIGLSEQPLNAAQFNAYYCNTGHDFLYCYTSVTGTWVATRRADHVHTCVEAVAGAVHRRLEYDAGAFAGWNTYVSATVNQGSMGCTFLQQGNRANYRFTVDQATGDVWHGTLYGND